MGTHVVVKPFDGAPGTRYTAGQVVDATAWPNTAALIRTRYIRERTVAEAAGEQQKARPVRDKR